MTQYIECLKILMHKQGTINLFEAIVLKVTLYDLTTMNQYNVN